MGGTTFSRNFPPCSLVQVDGVRMEFLGKDLVVEAGQGFVTGIVASHNVRDRGRINVVRISKNAQAGFRLGFLHRKTGKEVVAHLDAGLGGSRRNLKDRHIAAALIDVMLRGQHLDLRRHEPHRQVQHHFAAPTPEKAPPGIVEGRDAHGRVTLLQRRNHLAAHQNRPSGGAHGACGPELPPAMRARGNNQIGLVNDLPILHDLHRQRLEVVFRVLCVHDEFRSLAQAFGWLRQEDRGSLAARHFPDETHEELRPKRRGGKPPPLLHRFPTCREV